MAFTYFAVIIIISVMFMFMLMLWYMFKGLQDVLINGVQEAIIIAGEDLGQRIDNMQVRINALQKEIANITNLTQTQSQTQSPEVIEGMLNVISELQRETDSFLKDFAAKVEKSAGINNKTLAAFDEEIKRFTRTLTESIKQIQAAGDEHNNLLAKMASSFQGVLNTSSLDIKDAFTKTDDELKMIITDSMKSINRNYEDNIRKIFQAMADNLASIKEALKKKK